MILNWAQTRSQRHETAGKLKSNPTFHAWQALRYVYGPSDCFSPLHSHFFLLTISTFLLFSALQPFRAPLLSPWGVASSLSAFYQLPLAFPSLLLQLSLPPPPAPFFPSPGPLISLPSMCLPFTKFHLKDTSSTNEMKQKKSKTANKCA